MINHSKILNNSFKSIDINLFEQEKSLADLIYAIVLPISSLIGIVLNILNSIVFRKCFYQIYPTISSKNYLFYNSIFSFFGIIAYTFAYISLCGPYCPSLSSTYQAKIIYLISIYFGNAIFCLLTFNHFVISLKQYSALNQNFKKLSNHFEKIPIKCVFMFFLIYVIPMPLGFNITKLENSKYKIQIGSIETDKIRIALLRLAYLGYQILLLSLVILNFILSFHLIKLILKRNRLIKSNKLKFNFSHITKKQIRKKKNHIKCLLMIIWITFLFSSIHLNSFLYNFFLNKRLKLLSDYSKLNHCWGVTAFSLNFFVFYFTNKIFRKVLKFKVKQFFKKK